MQRFARKITALSLLFSAGHGAADVIYSGLQNTTIPTTYAGITIDVDGLNGWDLNPFMGGVYLYNNTLFQPARDGTGGMDTVLNFAPGSIISSSLNFATGTGGSMDHLGINPVQFNAGDEGYIGFKLNGTDYGWMRVVFTNNNTGALIKDWAYNTGGTIATGNILQSGSIYTLDSSTQSFTLGSAIADANSVVKTGANTATLSGINTYSGTTSVNEGTLAIASSGSTHASSDVTVTNSGSALVVNGTVNGTLVANVSTTLSGSGSVGGAATVSGNLTPGTGAGLLTFGSSLALANTTSTTMEIAGMTIGVNYDAIDVNDSLTYDGMLTLAIGATFGTGSYTFNLFDFASQTGSFDSITLSNLYSGSLVDNGFGVWAATTNSGNNTWTFTQSTGDLSLVVVPEPAAAFLGGLGLLMLLRRR